jgi:hypothetical protein
MLWSQSEVRRLCARNNNESVNASLNRWGWWYTSVPYWPI